MPWRLRLFANSSAAFKAAAGDDLEVGWGWRDSAGNLTLQTPGGLGRVTIGTWTISGEGEKLTVAPSILVSDDVGPRYHGFLRDGILTDDCDGRKFPQYPATA